MVGKGYVQLRRGIIEHFKVMSSSEIKVYIGVLVLANYKTAKVNITLAELADIISLDKKITLNSLHRLEKFGYVKFTPAKNQWHSSMIEITNYNGRVKKPIPPTTALPTAPTIALPTAKDVTNSNNTKLQKPKNYKEVLKNKYKYLKEEIFEDAYKNYLEMRKKIRKPATLRAEELVLNELHKHDLETAVKMLEQSIVNSWQGIFSLKEKETKFFTNQEDFDLLTRAKEELGRMAKVEDIVKWLKKLPKHLHSQIRLFLITRYPKDGDQAYGNAEVLYTRGTT